MIKREEIKLESNGSVSEHVYYFNEEASNLVLFFPGGSSNTTGPIFYYLRDYFLRNGTDVLSLSYKGLTSKGDNYDQQMKKIKDNIYYAIQHINSRKHYRQTIFVSRSFGNVVSNTIRESYKMEIDKSIYISPIPQSLQLIEENPGLIITSGNDEYLSTKDKQKMLLYLQHTVLVFDDGDHCLESEDTIQTMDFCIHAITKAIEYIEG